MQDPVTPLAEQPLQQYEGMQPGIGIAQGEVEGAKKRERCKNGTRRNKNGDCEPINASRKRCPNGTRKNKDTGECDPINVDTVEGPFAAIAGVVPEDDKQQQQQQQPQTQMQRQRQPRCPNGTRRNKKTGACEPAQKRPRCPNGTRRNKQTGNCDPIPQKPQEEQRDNDYNENIEIENEIENEQLPSPLPLPESEMPEMPIQQEGQEQEQEQEQREQEEEQKQEEEQEQEQEQEQQQVNSNGVRLYPEPGDPKFNEIMANKKEFHEVRYDKMDEFTVEEYANRICSEGDVFELAPHQLFARNFLSALTPYKSLLLYHGLGTGKTCSAISVSEEMRDYMKDTGVNKRIYVVAAPTIRLNFKQQLYNSSKLVLNRETGVWSMNTCMGKKLLKELRIKPVSPNITRDQESIMRESIIARIKSLIQKTYSFIGYEKLRLIIDETLVGRAAKSTQSTLANISEQQIQRIRARFDDTLIVIDEVHNLRTTGENESDDAKMTGKLLTLVARHTRNMRMLLLTATPMYNSPKEIIWLINLMRINDNRPEISHDKVFVGTGTDETIRTVTDDDPSRSAYSSGKEILKSASYGYISYVKGENPFTFPYRIYPKDHSPDHSFFSDSEEGGGRVIPFPTMNYNGLRYPTADIATQIRFLDIYLTPIGEEQQKVYSRCIDKLKDQRDDSRPEMAASDSDSDSNDDRVSESESESESESDVDEDADASPGLKPKAVAPKPSGYDEIATKFGFKSRSALQSLTMSFPPPAGMSESEVDPKTLVGQSGFKQVMTAVPIGQEAIKYKYKDGAQRVFSRDQIGRWSNKISSVCKHALECDGIVLVYTEYIEGGAVPVALALEEHGFKRFGGNNLLMNPTPTNPNPASGKRAPTYTMITGNKMLTPTSVVSVATAKNNTKGEIIKVIIITKAGSEGIDLKNIRQVHVIDPWYNLSLIEQVIGRAVRNCSHVDLPFEHRNVCIFIHGTRLPASATDVGSGAGASSGTGEEVEALDVSLLHHAESKAKRIGNVNAILKKHAVDCNLNKGYNVPKFKDGNSTVRQVLTTFSREPGAEGGVPAPIVIERYDVKMKPRTDACDYQNECDFACEPDLDSRIRDMGTDIDTYNMKFLEMNSERVIHRVRALFKERFFYTEDELIRHVNQIRTYTDEQIMVALNTLITDPYETLTDYYGREGRLIQIGNYYLFQPEGITNSKIGLRERAMPIDEGVDAIEVQLPTGAQPMATTSSATATATTSSASAASSDPAVNRGSQGNNNIAMLFGIYKIILDSITSDKSSQLLASYMERTGGDSFISYVTKFSKQAIRKGVADENTVVLACLSHYMDTFSNDDMLEIINRVKVSNPNPEIERFEQLIDAYIRRYIITCDGGKKPMMIVPTSSITAWANADEPSNGKISDSEIVNHIETKFFRNVDFIGLLPQSVPAGKWKKSSSFGDKDRTILSKCVLDWFVATRNKPLVQSIGKDKDVIHNNIPYKVGCTRWSSSKSAHEFILIDMKIQKSVIHGQVPTKKPEIVEFLKSILATKNCNLEDFVKVSDEGRAAAAAMPDQGDQDEMAKKAKGIIKAPIQSLVVFTELLLRILDAQDGSGIRWMLRPCELQLVTKVGSIYHTNKLQIK
jgi:hypothetical protein